MDQDPSNRRRHRIFKTKHTEYHLREDECVGVRDRGSGLWSLDHAALRLRALTLPTMGEGAKWLGRRIQFWGRRTDVLTSPVCEVDRPMRIDIGNYCSQAKANASGEIMSGLLVSCPTG